MEQILSGIGVDPDKPKIFMKKNVRNHPYHQFYLVLVKIRINRGLLYFLNGKLFAVDKMIGSPGIHSLLFLSKLF